MSDAEVRAAMEAAMIASQGNLSNAAVRAKSMSLMSPDAAAAGRDSFDGPDLGSPALCAEDLKTPRDEEGGGGGGGASGASPPKAKPEITLPTMPEPERVYTEGADFKLVESVLSILFLRKFDQFAQMEEVLKRSLATVPGRKALVDVLSARRDQWAVCTNKQVFDGLRTVAAAALAAIDNLLEMAAEYSVGDGGDLFEQFCRAEAGKALPLPCVSTAVLI
eukprot:SAG22_NODE_2785_length_2211_cov_14.169981_2_plen_221_part_00